MSANPSKEIAAPSALAAADVHCKCGAWSGDRCQWSGPLGDTAVVEWMPRYLRGSHAAAGSRGVYGANGAERIRVSSDCAQQMLDRDPDWCSIVSYSEVE
jgi:hypothetical protein